MSDQAACDACDATGRVDGKQCRWCSGTGRISCMRCDRGIPSLGRKRRRYLCGVCGHRQYGRQHQEEAFWLKVRKAPGCWPWLGFRKENKDNGYGMARWDGKTVLAHRVSWRLANGPVPKGLCVLHRCDNPPCVNPEHLFLGTLRENTRDMMAKGRSRWTGPKVPLKGSAAPASKIKEHDVVAIFRLRAEGATLTELARKYDLAPATVSAILLRQSWRHVDVDAASP